MAKSPIQIVLNSSDFIQTWDRKGGGPRKDFYADNDKDFVAHRTKLAEQLAALMPKQNGNKFSDISYAKVTLKQSALAKTHRPTTAIFNRETAPVMGGGDLGELFIELQPSSIQKISEKVLQAESKTKWKEKDGIRTPNPSSIRSEVGAIEEIQPYTASDKRKFSISEGLKWLADPRTGGAYIVELFEIPPPRQVWDSLPQEKLKLFKSFVDGLSGFGNGLVASRVIGSERNIPMIGIRLDENSKSSNVQFIPTRSAAKRQALIQKIDLSRTKHTSLMTFLDNHPLVRKITLPPVISKSASTITKVVMGKRHTIPLVVAKRSYPKVAIVDGGVSEILNDWIEDRHGLLSPSDKDVEHGTFIAGLLLSGNSLNGTEICSEIDGCKIIDLDLLPKDNLFPNYYADSLQFFDELDNAVRDLKAKTGVRIFNFSLNVSEHVSTDDYSLPARRLDEIAEGNDVIFIISAGNALPINCRKEWPSKNSDALQILASSRNDTIMKPGESYRNLSVAALNPPNLAGIVPFALSNYSCRGPGTRIGLKPDLAHVGGSGTKILPNGHGLLSFDKGGKIVDGCGTSYAAPNVAKSLACLEHAIEGNISRESLIGLAIHHARIPEVMTHRDFKNVAKDLVGFGVPDSSDEILNGSDSSITLVFANRVYPGRRMSFNFSWPSTLVKAGKCLGYARLTIVSTPPFDYRFGSEFVRINVEGNLRQMQEDGTFKGRLSSVYLPDSSDGLHEKTRIEHSFKWSPVKVFEREFKRGIGPSADWRLDIEYLARDGENLPQEGVPFTALLTIADPAGEVPVFNVMRQTLQSTGVQILDIKTATRVIPRV